MSLRLLHAAESIDSTLYQARLDLPNESIYELVGTQNGLGWSVVIADII